jgi:hypothetical protein
MASVETFYSKFLAMGLFKFAVWVASVDYCVEKNGKSNFKSISI